MDFILQTISIMVLGIITQTEAPFSNENIATRYSNFNQNDSWVILSGNAEIETLANSPYSYFGGGALKVDFLDADTVEFNAGDNKLLTVARNTGLHVFSLAFFKPESTSSILFDINIFVNGFLLPENTIRINVQDDDLFVSGKWNIYYQTINLNSGDEVDFSFSAISDEGSDTVLYVDRFSLEYDINNVSLPCIYQEVAPLVIKSSQTIDIPSISSNSSVIATATVTGAKVGMFVSIDYPSALITDELCVGVPIVSATNTVSFVVHNHSGGSINPTSGTFNFRVYE
jgi:hypothetical protein